jgi:hypothetical protein
MEVEVSKCEVIPVCFKSFKPQHTKFKVSLHMSDLCTCTDTLAAGHIWHDQHGQAVNSTPHNRTGSKHVNMLGDMSLFLTEWLVLQKVIKNEKKSQQRGGLAHKKPSVTHTYKYNRL